MYKTINGWTKARMIEQIYKRNNGKKSVDGSGRCRYRGENGNACAAGCFIPDEVYTPLFEHSRINSIFKDVSEHMPLDLLGLRRLQLQHDEFDEHLAVSDMRERLAAWIEENVEEGE